MSPAEETPDPSCQGSGATVRAKFRPARGLRAAVKPEPPAPPGRHRRTRSERLARQLALAHWIERAIESGQAASYGEVARVLGLTESRITQVTAFLGLSPGVQEGILIGEGSIGIREAIRAGRQVEWGEAGRLTIIDVHLGQLTSVGARPPRSAPCPELLDDVDSCEASSPRNNTRSGCWRECRPACDCSGVYPGNP